MTKATSRRIFLTTEEVADLFGVHHRTINRWIDAGTLPGYRLPGPRGARRILKARLIDFIRARPEFHFALELLHGQPITAGHAGTAAAQGCAAESPDEDRSEDAGWSGPHPDDPGGEGADAD